MPTGKRSLNSLHRLLSIPAIYELVQQLAGRDRVVAWLRGKIPESRRRVLDVGSASGVQAQLLGATTVSIDVDITPLAALRRRQPGSLAVCASASSLPFKNRSADLLLFFAVSHHLDDQLFPLALSELARVTSSQVMFFDAVRTDRAMSRLLWMFDRGAHPRTVQVLQSAFEKEFPVVETDALRVLHDYRLFIGRLPSVG